MSIDDKIDAHKESIDKSSISKPELLLTPPTGRTLIQYPLTSFASTPHNVASISFLLGALWSLGLVSSSYLLFNKTLLWSTSTNSIDLLPTQSLSNAIKSPILGIYLSCWAIYHLFEFLVTSIWNPDKLTVSSFLLDNGIGYHIAHLVGILEHILGEAYLPAEYRKVKHMGALVMLGWGLVIGGQILRSFAMITASSNFSHIVAYRKLATHELVTNGIYSWSRHPSYAGFVWWALGTQVLLANPISFLAFAVVLYKFFSARIAIEERLLIKFFGDKYIEYRQKVPTRILFIR